ncbi:bifunctional 2-polyprenyl-6-hydroxyphenol methylase/3-demethylubiquinol 3-O-methyltransferase UbiG [Accumulibacter sp.]|uniref:class I SAM-dependent methyltransferase n=1 Tax=Accumulibacter sp. TaxID=2053492 RepID=UPI0025F6846A|nr:methyltransferase domain-containing protein [Accumulibacter sp.]MCM8594227.1 class I SAM-dependent methyltransferase [Accumulibacter sp.]MCM8625793.1 class I SAM-dependent methyltransferase [Accumulibacter sp.]MDS4048370.1 methyltransferase domain-containing protein [Accumulibacter sp.]
MMTMPLAREELACAICGSSGAVSEIDTYKSTWLFCASCGCYSRIQKAAYPLERAARALLPVFRYVPKLNGFLHSLGRKKQGVDFYRYYSEQLASGERGPWVGQFEMVTAELRSADLLVGWSGCKVLEISGEPGYFAQDLMKAGADVVVSAFADDVARAMSERLGVNTLTYDFNADDIVRKVAAANQSGPFDFVFIRFAIGFCEDVPVLMRKLSSLLKQGGLLYVSFSPASRAVLLRWMFDDYTYLRQYTEAHLSDAAAAADMRVRARFDEGYFHWDRGPHSLHWSLRPFARRYFNANPFYRDGDEYDAVQRRVALVFCRG